MSNRLNITQNFTMAGGFNYPSLLNRFETIKCKKLILFIEYDFRG